MSDAGGVGRMSVARIDGTQQAEINPAANSAILPGDVRGHRIPRTSQQELSETRFCYECPS